MKKQASRLILNETHDRLDEIQNDISTGYVTACDEINEYIKLKQQEENERMIAFHKRYLDELTEMEGKTNFDAITESPEKLIQFISIIAIECVKYHHNTGEISFDEDGIVDYLNQKAGE